MLNSKITKLPNLIILFILMFFPYFLSQAQKPGEYFDSDAIIKFRNKKNIDFKKEDSPLLAETRKDFTGLKYYEPIAKFCVKARYTELKKKDTIDFATSKKEKTKKFLRFGKFSFSIDGKDYELFAYLYLAGKNKNELFLPFTDLTNEDETYHGGRYLDIEISKGEENYIIDFNYAYNPLCSYNPKFTCPLVPLENHVKQKILAGEKLFLNDN
ncbi:MAG: hypothetical protein HW421_2844 [Ignavibacteria bacterium]|nr:hypothetical protein [Ignavibacteria bacterium]